MAPSRSSVQPVARPAAEPVARPVPRRIARFLVAASVACAVLVTTAGPACAPSPSPSSAPAAAGERGAAADATGRGETDPGGTPAPPPPTAAVAPAAPVISPAAPGPRVFPASRLAELDGPDRDLWQRPDEVVAALGIRRGDRIGDVGCGTGYFTLRLLRAAGSEGRVIATDIQQGMLDRLSARLLADDRERVTMRLTPPDRPLEPGDALDLVFLANTLHEVDDGDAPRFVKCLAAALAPGGRLVTLDWLPEPMNIGPPADHRITPARVRSLAEDAGLAFTRSLGTLSTHSFLVFTKPR